MTSPWLQQLDPFWLKMLVIIELALPFYLLLGIFWARFLIAERLCWKQFPSTVPLILLVIPAVAALHEHWLKLGVLFAVIYLFSFVLFGMREHLLFYDCALPWTSDRDFQWPRWLVTLQIFWFLQAPAAAFCGLNWPRGLAWTETIIAAIALAFWLVLIVATAQKRKAKQSK